MMRSTAGPAALRNSTGIHFDCCDQITSTMGVRPQMDEPHLHPVHAAAVHHRAAADLSS
jgi:hypothetical protein